MEHLPDPLSVLKELRRILNDDGLIFFSAPFYYEEREKPYDFYRYTQFGVRLLFSEAGFEATDPLWLERLLRNGRPPARQYGAAPSSVTLKNRAWLARRSRQPGANCPADDIRGERGALSEYRRPQPVHRNGSPKELLLRLEGRAHLPVPARSRYT
jgi:hypothetical protein